MKTIWCVALFTIATITLRAQSYDGPWLKASGLAETHGAPMLRPERYLSYTIAESAIKTFLATVPSNYERGITLNLPAPDGSVRAFRIWNTPAMEDGLAMKYPDITTYTAEAIGARHITAKLDYTPYGFHALVFDGTKTYFIDPYGSTADGAYIVYYKSDIAGDVAGQMTCGVADKPDEIHPGRLSLNENGLPALRMNGAVRRQYRMALACTGEFAVSVAGPSPTKAAVLAKMVTMLNQVNGIYERELSVTMQLVANNTDIIFLDAATDPYGVGVNTNIYMLDENQSAVDLNIGTSNYDIGHLLTQGSSGIANLGCVCWSNYKAGGASGGTSPKSSYILAHEIGHQFGADHTFNASGGACTGTSEDSRAFEPGSGSTIMSYAGGSCFDNLQNIADDYFHATSLEQISTYITPPKAGSSCATTTTSANSNATLPLISKTYAIPSKTPFELTAPAAVDATADLLTYCWEQKNLGDFGQTIALTGANGPIFRSYPPDTSSTRVFPRIEALTGKTPLNGEKLPDVARRLTFRLTERDIYQGWGAFTNPDDSIVLNVINTTAPFTVTSQFHGEYYYVDSRPRVTWNEADTKLPPISCPNVDIYMSVDSGYTYPYLLAAGTPNDGSEYIQLPALTKTTFGARIKVKCSNNVFFNISGTNFTVEVPLSAAQAFLPENVRITPVPARDVLNIDVPDALGAMQIRVINTLGQLIWTGTVNTHASLNVSGWARGVYQVHMYNEEGVQLRRKIIVE